MAGFTNRGKFRIMEAYFRGGTIPAQLNAALVTSATAPGADTNTLSQLTEIAAGNGYTSGGIAVTLDATGFPTSTEDDTNDRASLIVKDLVWTASGGALPGSGSGARYVVLTDNNATVGSREIIAYGDLGSDRSVSDGQTLTVADWDLRANES